MEYQVVILSFSLVVTSFVFYYFLKESDQDFYFMIKKYNELYEEYSFSKAYVDILLKYKITPKEMEQMLIDNNIQLRDN